MLRSPFKLLPAAMLLAAVAGSLSAQQDGSRQRAARRVPVTVVLVDRLPNTDAAFLVQRRPELRPHDVILLRSDATAATLDQAVRTLLTARQISGDSARTRVTTRMRPQQQARAARREFPWVGRVLADLRKAGRTDVPGLGRVRSVEIWLPRQAAPRNQRARP